MQLVNELALALVISVISGVAVAWLLSVLKSSSKLTWRLSFDASLGDTLPINVDYRDLVGRAFRKEVITSDEYHSEYQKPLSYSKIYAVEMRNTGAKASNPVSLVINNEPVWVGAFPNVGIEVKPLKGGVFHLTVPSVPKFSSVTVSYIANFTSLLAVQSDGEVLAEEPSIFAKARRSNKLITDIIKYSIIFAALSYSFIFFPDMVRELLVLIGD